MADNNQWPSDLQHWWEDVIVWSLGPAAHCTSLHSIMWRFKKKLFNQVKMLWSQSKLVIGTFAGSLIATSCGHKNIFGVRSLYWLLSPGTRPSSCLIWQSLGMFWFWFSVLCWLYCCWTLTQVYINTQQRNWWIESTWHHRQCHHRPNETSTKNLSK